MMFKKLFREMHSEFPVVVALVATCVSIIMFLFLVKPIEYTSIVIGVIGAIAGAILVYSFARVQALSDAPSIFISYSKKDSAFAHQVAEHLGKFPVKVILDVREFKVGDDITQKLGALVDQCDYFAFVMSENYLQSVWSISELNQAIKKRKKVLPLVIESVALPAVIKDIVYADFTQSFDAGMAMFSRSFRDKKYYKAANSGSKKRRASDSRRYKYKGGYKHKEK